MISPRGRGERHAGCRRAGGARTPGKQSREASPALHCPRAAATPNGHAASRRDSWAAQHGGPRLGSPPRGHIWGPSPCGSGLGLFPGHSPRPGSPERASTGNARPGAPRTRCTRGEGRGRVTVHPARGDPRSQRARPTAPHDAPPRPPTQPRQTSAPPHPTCGGGNSSGPPTVGSSVATDQLLGGVTRCWPPLRRL